MDQVLRLPPPPPPGMEFGGCCSFLIVPGYLSTTAEEAARKQSLAMQSEGEKSDADLVKLLGASQVVAPITDDQVCHLFHTLSKFFEILARKKPCIASSGYALAAELVLEHGRDIDKVKNDPDEEYFLLHLCHSVDLDCRFLFQSFFQDILSIGINTYSINLCQVLRRQNDDIEKILHGLKRGNTSAIKFPSNLLALVHSHSQQQSSIERSRGKGGDIDHITPPAKQRKTDNDSGRIMRKHQPDAWSAPPGVTNPIATYFPDTETGNANKARVAKIKLRHHAMTQGSQELIQSPICLPFHFEGSCPVGKRCTENHHSRSAIMKSKPGTWVDEGVKMKVKQLDDLFVAVLR